jgi:hypothetical protein
LKLESDNDNISQMQKFKKNILLCAKLAKSFKYRIGRNYSLNLDVFALCVNVNAAKLNLDDLRRYCLNEFFSWSYKHLSSLYDRLDPQLKLNFTRQRRGSEIIDTKNCRREYM